MIFRVVRDVIRAENINKFQLALEPLLRRVVSLITSYVFTIIAYVISLLQFQEYLQRLHTFRNGKISSKSRNLLHKKTDQQSQLFFFFLSN